MVVDVYVVDFKPLGFDFILGIKGISALGDVTIFPSLATCFGSAKTDEKPVCAGATKVEKPVCVGATKVEKPVCAGGDAIDEPDFCVSFEASEKAWTVTWKWSDDAEPDSLRNRVTEYSIPTSASLSYEAEIEDWLTNGWLEPYDDKKLGLAK